MTQQVRMGVEVGQVAKLIGDVIGCRTCAMGIAVCLVGERYGYAPFENWRCTREKCRVRKEGTTAEQGRAIDAIVATLPPADAHLDVLAADHSPSPDSRLPRERDDEAPL